MNQTKTVEIYNANTRKVTLSRHEGWTWAYYSEDKKVCASLSDLCEDNDWICLDALEELVRKMREFDSETKEV